MYINRFRETRLKKGLTQQQTAEAVGLSTMAVQNYENNRRKPAYDVLIALADYLGVSIDYLVGRTDNPQIAR